MTMERDPYHIEQEINEIEDEIATLDQSLTRARHKKKQLETERRMARQREQERMARQREEDEEERRRQAQEQRQGGTSGGESPDELRRRIEELKQQVKQKKKVKKPAMTQAPPPRRQQEEESEEDSSDSEEEVQQQQQQTRPKWGGRAASRTAESPSSVVESPSRAPAPAPEPPMQQERHEGDVHREQLMDSIKQQYQWEKPAWATPAPALETDQSIITDSILNPNLRSAGTGYVRQVMPGDLPELVKGKFVAPEKVILDPRLAWLVLNLDGYKVGKIVLHLHGKDVNKLVDRFGDLKGLSVERGPGNTLSVPDLEPMLTITTGSARGLAGKKNVYGVLQEGRDVFDRVMSSDAEIDIKQSHIYPVKKSNKR